jgi:hypothetical protein
MTDNQASQQQGPDELRKALVEVRKAYRILWHYQDHVLNMLRTIVAQFKDVHFNASFFRPEGGGVSNPLALQYDAWDMLPMFEMDILYFNYQKNPPNPFDFPQYGDYLLDLHLTCDTGHCSWSERDPRRFEAPEDCESRLAFYIFVNKRNRVPATSWRDKIWWPTARGATPYLEPGQVLQHRQVSDVSIYGDEFDLIKLCDKNAIIDCVHQFKQKVKDNLLFDIDKRTFI